MNHYEKTLSSETIYSGRIMDLKVDQVELPDGKHSMRELVNHKDGVGILCVRNDCFLFVKQFRKAIDSIIVEIPAGLVEVGEDIGEAAERELQEEIGLKPLNLEFLGDMWPSPGFCNEKTSLFIATDFLEAALEADDDEFIEVIEMPVDTVRTLFLNGMFTDAKTACALGRYFSLCR